MNSKVESTKEILGDMRRRMAQTHEPSVCKKCDAKDIEVCETDPDLDFPDGGFKFYCYKCEKEGPVGETREEALKLWNEDN